MTAFPKTDLARLMASAADIRPLALLAALRFVAEDDLVAIGGTPPEQVQALVDSEQVFRFALQRRLTTETPTQVLAIRKPGARALAQALDIDPGSVPFENRSTARRSAMFLDHTLARSRFALLLAKGLASGTPAALLSWEHDPERLADHVQILEGPGALGRQPLVADALAACRGPKGPEGLLIEIDRGTERPNYVGRKMAHYLAWWRAGGPLRRFDLPAIRILVATPDDRRALRLVEACREATDGKASGLFWFASEKDLAQGGVLGPVWHTTKADHLPLWP